MAGGSDPTDWKSPSSDALFVSVTSDYGKTWSRVVQIGQNPQHERRKPWINYSPNGILGVSYKTVYDAGYDAWAAISPDGGFHFDPPIRISHAISAPQPSEAGDDYGTVALDDKYLYFAWGDMRRTPNSSASGSLRSLYFGRVARPAPQQRTHR